LQQRLVPSDAGEIHVSQHDQPRQRRAPETTVPEERADDWNPLGGPVELPDFSRYDLGPEEHYFHAEWWQPASWQPHSPAPIEGSEQLR
jgi:hypothetical protein